MSGTMRGRDRGRQPTSAPSSWARSPRDLHRQCGYYLRKSAKLQKQIALAGGIDEADVSRMVNGDPRAPKIVTAYYELVRRLGRDDKTTASFLIAGSVVEATQVAVEHFTRAELRQRLRDAQDSEDRAEARANIAEKQVARAEADLNADPSPETFAAYSRTLEEHRLAAIEEISWTLEVEICGGALLRSWARELGLER